MQTAKPIQKTSTKNGAGVAPLILTINGGSSSIKFALFSAALPPRRAFSGQVKRIGVPGTLLTATREDSSELDKHPISVTDFRDAIQGVLTYLRQRISKSTISAIGHRIVKGGLHLVDNQFITADVIAELRRMQPLDLDHLPRETKRAATVHQLDAANP
jgi:acetate kinase